MTAELRNVYFSYNPSEEFFDGVSEHTSADLGNSEVRAYEQGGNTRWALNNISVTVRAGEYIALTGANGSGKSTLGRILAGLASPDRGHVCLMGVTVYEGTPLPQAYDSLRGRIGAVFQNPEDQIIATTAGDDVAFAPENLAVPCADIESRVQKSLACVGMKHQEHADPVRMSGGEQQRIAIAGIVAMRPEMLVLDEPTAMLSPQARADILQILDELHAAGITIIHITHKADEIVRAKRVIRMENGRIVSDAGQDVSSELSEGRDTGNTHTCAAFDSLSEPRAAVDTNGAIPRGNVVVLNNSEVQNNRAVQDHRNAPIISVRNLSYVYPNSAYPAITDFSLDVLPGEIVAIMGENGSGKTTFTRLLTAFLRPSSGSIVVDGHVVACDDRLDSSADAARQSSGASRHRIWRRHRPVMLPKKQRRSLREKVGLVMQHPERQLFAQSVYDDVAYGPRNQQLSEESVAARVRAALELAGIEHLAERVPQELSGGEQRLAAIAGVLACQPKVLILDEPTASLDADAVTRIHATLTAARERGVTIIIVTHSCEEAYLLADRIVVMPSPVPAYASKSACAEESHVACGKEEIAGKRRPFLARRDPRIVLISFTVLVLSMFTISTFSQLAAAAALIVGLIVMSGGNIFWIVRSMRVWLPMLIVMAIVNFIFVRTGDSFVWIGSFAVTVDGVRCAVIYSLRFALAIMLGISLMNVFTPMVLVDSVAAMLAPLQRWGARVQELALVAGLALRFFPTLTAETRSIVTAQAARGGQIESGGLLARLKALGAIALPAFAGALRHADNVGLALEARAYSAGVERTRRRELVMYPMDWLFALLVLGCDAVLITMPYWL